jgi:diacylglycerol kinase family enzyme
VNAHAGTVERQGEGDLHRQIALAFATHGASANIEIVEPAELHGGAQRALEKAAKLEIDGVVAGGGDGSIRTVAEVLAGTAVPLGVLPLGTLNHFARDLGLPTNMNEAIAVICAAHTRAVDLGEVNGQVFLNNSSVGIYPYMVLDRDRRRRATGLNKWLAMGLALLRTLHHLPIRRMQISADGQTGTSRTPCLFVGNNAYELSSPSFSRREHLDRGLLWLCVAKPKTAFALIWLAIRSFFGFLIPQTELRTFDTATVDVATRTSRLIVALDGEVEIMRPPLRYRIRPKELLVYAPPGPA